VNIWWFILLLITSTYFLTGLVRHYSLSKKLLDIPNERSSHSESTPRGGGVAFVIIFILSLIIFSLNNKVQPDSLWAVFGSGLWIAIVGFLDDHGHIPAIWRLLAHAIGAMWALWWLDGLPPLSMFGTIIDFGLLGHILAAIYLIWLINLYNFMDGINGIASIEAITVCLGGIVLYYLFSIGNNSDWLFPLLLLATVLGFLYWNFPHAKIFMGDAGSGFIGILLGIFSIQAAWVSPGLFWAWLILLGVFIIDATVTLIARLLHREKIYEAHRSHAYQWSARKWGHTSVTIGVLLINLFWLFPLAFISMIYPKQGILIVLLAFLPLTVLALKFGAGRTEQSQ